MAGGKREGAGRPKGSVNKATADIRALAQLHGPAAVEALVGIMQSSESEPARVAAAKEILDRAYGKSKQPIEGTDDGPPINVAARIAFEVVKADLAETRGE